MKSDPVSTATVLYCPSDGCQLVSVSIRTNPTSRKKPNDPARTKTNTARVVVAPTAATRRTAHRIRWFPVAVSTGRHLRHITQVPFFSARSLLAIQGNKPLLFNDRQDA